MWKTFTQDYNLNTLIVEQGSNSVINRSYGYQFGDFSITNIWDTNVAARSSNWRGPAWSIATRHDSDRAVRGLKFGEGVANEIRRRTRSQVR